MLRPLASSSSVSSRSVSSRRGEKSPLWGVGTGGHAGRLPRRVQRRGRAERSCRSDDDSGYHHNYGADDGGALSDDPGRYRLRHQRRGFVRRRAPAGQLGHPLGRCVGVVPDPGTGVGPGLAVRVYCRHQRHPLAQHVLAHFRHGGQHQPPAGRVPGQPAGGVVERRPYHVPRLRLQLAGPVGPRRLQGRRRRPFHTGGRERLRRHFQCHRDDRRTAAP